VSEKKTPSFVDLIDPESVQIREVYAQFGVAIYMAQALERTLGIALATVYRSGPRRITRGQYDSLLQSNFEKTLGQLVAKLRKSVAIPRESEDMLSEALRKRNWLVHDYFWERAASFNRPEGRQSMIDELKTLIEYLEEVDARFTAIVEEWGDKHGVTQATVDREMKKLMDAGDARASTSG
jgi:hypothetical protein